MKHPNQHSNRLYLIRDDLGHITATARTLAAALTLASAFDSVLCVSSFIHVRLPRRYRGSRDKVRARAERAKLRRER